mmetsp:Transcript_99702/g.179947  ORF Transcript_99702/g.179947 Transcript_99702/m.179947 type:complete len:289 (-) Transcript_99702:15-881(-)
MTFSSERSSEDTYLKAAPWLVIRTLSMSWRSALTSAGAPARSCQSSTTAALQMAWRQLFVLTAEELPSPSERLPNSGTPFFSAAAAMLCIMTEEAASWERSLSPVEPLSLRDATYWRLSSASSEAGRSLVMLNSFLNLSALLSLVMIAAFALVRKNKLGMSKQLAATQSSKRSSLSTFTKLESHRVAPHSCRLSLSSGVRISPVECSLWCFRYSTTFAKTNFFSGNGSSSSQPFSITRLRTRKDRHAASAGSSKTSPSFDLSFTRFPANSGELPTDGAGAPHLSCPLT